MMSTVRCLSSAGRSVGQGLRILSRSQKQVSRLPLLRQLGTSSVIWKEKNTLGDDGKKAAPPPPPISGGGRGNKDGMCCPKCGENFTNVETFVG